MGMPQTIERWTADMVRALPDDGNRYEVIDGELLVTPAPALRHQRAVSELLRALLTYVTPALGEVLTSPADISFADDMLVQPDILVAPRTADGHRARHWSDITRLVLAIEILSPTTARADRQVKRRLYQRHNVTEYWIVDLDARLIERWRPSDDRPEVLDQTLLWQPEPITQPLELDLAGFFRELSDS